MNFALQRRRSFIWGGITAAVFTAIAISTLVSSKDFSSFLTWFGLAVTGYTFVSCLILDNNFIGDMVLEIFSWGFVRMPGLIFTLDLDGIIWLLTVKLLFWIIELLLAAVCGILAIALGLLLSIVVYPFAIYKNIQGRE